jgi:hypothetical protein
MKSLLIKAIAHMLKVSGFATWELTVARRRTLRERIGERIARRRDDVFLTREFRDLGDIGDIGDKPLRSVMKGAAGSVTREPNALA